MLKVGQTWKARNGWEYEIVSVDMLNKKLGTKFVPKNNELPALNLTIPGGWNAYKANGESEGGSKELQLVTMIKDVEDTEVKNRKLSAVEHAVNIIEIMTETYNDDDLNPMAQVRALAKYLKDNDLV